MKSEVDIIVLEDVLNVMEKLSTRKKKLIVVMDEFQQVNSINKDLPAKLSVLMEHHKNINYVFLSSQEKLIREIFSGGLLGVLKLLK